jgi:hypothetical protein
MLLRSPLLTSLVALLVPALGGCDGGGSRSGNLVGRYAVTGRFVNTIEVSATSPGCGVPVPEADLAGHLSVFRSDGGVRVLNEGPGCTTEAWPRGDDRHYAADDATCVIDPNGAYQTLGITGVLYRSFVLDLEALRWSYDLELTWPSQEFPDGKAKVCGRGHATLTRVAE